MVEADPVATVGDDQAERLRLATLTSIVLVAVAPVISPLSYTLVASANTWKTIEPLAATSSSTPTEALKRLHVPPRKYCTSEAACTPRPLG